MQDTSTKIRQGTPGTMAREKEMKYPTVSEKAKQLKFIITLKNCVGVNSVTI